MVQGTLETARKHRPQGSDFPLWTMPKTDTTPGDKKLPMKTVLYCRVSTADQTLEHQRTQGEAAGFRFDEVVIDHGVSGIRTALRERTEGRRLFDMLRAGDTLVVRWVDRLGRNYADVTDTVREFIRRGVIVRTVINGLTFDGATKDPMAQAVRDSLIAFMAAMAQSQAEVTKEAQKAGIVHALAKDDGTKYRGRKPTFTREQFTLVRELLNQGIPVSAIAKTAGLKRQSIYRIQAEPERQLAAIAAWYPNDEAVNQSHR
jgi:putative DNA-invertase from lambdoid prophage Rac